MSKWSIFVFLKIAEGLALFFVPLELGMFMNNITHEVSSVWGIWGIGVLYFVIGLVLLAVGVLGAFATYSFLEANFQLASWLSNDK